MPKRKSRRENVTTLQVRGFARAQIVDRKTGKVVGDTGFVKNTITKEGFDNMIVGGIVNAAGSKVPRFFHMGNQVSLSSNMDLWNTMVGIFSTANTSLVTQTNGAILRFTQNLSGAGHSPGGNPVNAVGVFNTSHLESAPLSSNLLAGTTFTSSNWANDQDIRITYELRFSQT